MTATHATKDRNWNGYPEGDPSNTYEHLMACDLPTSWLTRIALQCYTHDNGVPMWTKVDTTASGARDYYDSLDEDYRREEAATLLGQFCWTRSRICRVFS